MHKFTTYIDVDGVIFDYTKAFFEFCGIGTPVEELEDYDLTRFFSTPAECYMYMSSFGRSNEHHTMETLVPEHLLVEALAILSKRSNIVFITQVCDHSNRQYRELILNRMFKTIPHRVEFTARGECKYDIVSSRTGYSCIIEDNPNVLDKYELSHTHKDWAIAIRHPYNKKIVDTYRKVFVKDDLISAIDTVDMYVRLMEMFEYE